VDDGAETEMRSDLVTFNDGVHDPVLKVETLLQTTRHVRSNV